MKRQFLSIVIIIAILLFTGCSHSNNNIKKLNSSYNIKTMKSSKSEKVLNNKSSNQTLNKEHTFTKDDALKMVSKEYYNGSIKDLFIDDYPNMKQEVFVISQKIDFGSHLYTTMQAYLIKDNKIIDTLYDQNMNVNSNFRNHVNSYIMKPKKDKIQLNDYLCSSNEKVTYFFEVKKSKKKLAICTAKDDSYIVYRFGTKDHVELEYPSKKEDSWSKFMYMFYLRGGGVTNLGMDLNYLKFKNGNYIYIIYDEYVAEGNTNEIGVMVFDETKKRKTDNTYRLFDFEPKYQGVVIQGNYKSVKGSLMYFKDNNKIKEKNL